MNMQEEMCANNHATYIFLKVDDIVIVSCDCGYAVKSKDGKSYYTCDSYHDKLILQILQNEKKLSGLMRELYKQVVDKREHMGKSMQGVR